MKYSQDKMSNNIITYTETSEITVDILSNIKTSSRIHVFDYFSWYSSPSSNLDISYDTRLKFNSDIYHIPQQYKNDLVLYFDLTEGYFPGINNHILDKSTDNIFYEILSENKNCFIITANPYYKKIFNDYYSVKFDNILYFPFYWFIKFRNMNKVWYDVEKNNKFICLNGALKNRRYEIVKELYDIKDDGILTLLCSYEDNFSDFYKEDIFYKHNLPLIYDKSPNELYIDDKSRTDDMKSCFLNIVNETLDDNDNGIFFSEKTWKPIVDGQLFFITSGDPNKYYNFLKNYGFEIPNFEWVLEYDSFLKNIKEYISNFEINDNFKKTIHHNRKNFYNLNINYSIGI